MRLSFPPLKSWQALVLVGGTLVMGAQAAPLPPPVASKLAFAGLPGVLYNSGGLGTVTVQVQTSTGAVATASTATVTLSVTGPNSFSYSLSSAAVAGFATFNTTPELSALGTYTVKASSSGLTAASATVRVLQASYVLPATAVGASSAAQNVTFGFDSATQVASVQVLFQGASGLDFVAGSGANCVGAQIAGSTCTVPVIFKPAALGRRLGAVVLTTSTGASQTIYLSGIGQGAGANFTPHAQTQIGTFAGYPDALAFDGNNNLYVADYPADTGVGQVVKLPMVNGVPSTAQQAVVARDLEYVDGLAFDGAGNLFVSDYNMNKIIEVPANGGPDITLLANLDDNNPTTIFNPAGLTVDAAGNLFICDWGNNRIIEVPNQNGNPNPAAAIYIGQGLSAPSGIKVDLNGDLLVADWGNARIVRIPLQNGSYNSAAQTTILTDLAGQPADLALDPAGNMYLALENANAIEVVPFEGGAYNQADAYLVAKNLFNPDALTLDGAGNIYFCDTYNGLTYMLDTVHPPALAFGDVGVGQVSQPQTVPVLSLGNQPLSIASVQFAAKFPNQASTCTGTLNPGQKCNLNLSFAPSALGPVNDSATITDNAVNLPSPTQTIGLSGNGVLGPQTITLSPAGPLTFTTDPIPLVAVGGGSGNPVVLQVVSGPGSISGNQLTLTGTGTVVIAADQAGNSLYLPAPTTDFSLVVNPATPTYTWNPPTSLTYGPTLEAVTSASSPVPGTWSYYLNGSPVTAATIAPVGSWNIEAYFAPAQPQNYNVLRLNIVLDVTPATVQVIADNASMNQGDPVPAFTYHLQGLLNGESPLLIHGTPVLTTTATSASYGGTYPILVNVAGMSAADYVMVGVPGVLTVLGAGPQPQTITFPALPDVTWNGTPQTVALNATASSGLPVSYAVTGPATIAGSSLTVNGVGTIQVTATQAGNGGYLPAAPVSQSFRSRLAYASTTALDRRLDLRRVRPGDTLWVRAWFDGRGVHDGTIVTLTGAGLTYGPSSVALPGAMITFSAAARHASTHYDAATNTWQTTLPLATDHRGDEDHDGAWFLTGLAIPVPVPANWPDRGVAELSGTLAGSQPGLHLRWGWDVDVYTRWSSDNNALGVQADGDHGHGDDDHAGEPENFEHFRRGGDFSEPVGFPVWGEVCLGCGGSADSHVPAVHGQGGEGWFDILQAILNPYYPRFSGH
jgi:sugar lactone lactonase YvrE